MTHFKRFFVVFVLITVCFSLQCLVLPSIDYLIAVPNLLLVAVMTSGFLFGKATGLAAGVVSGLLLDLFASGVPGFYILILSWLGFIDGVFSEKIESELILVLYLFLFGNEIVFHAYQYLFSFLLDKSFVFKVYLTEVFVPEILLTMVFFLVFYGVTYFVSKKWDLKVNKGEVRVVH